MSSPVSILILAAGLGTRMRSRQAKVLHRAGGFTLVEHVVRTALQATTAEHIYVVIGHQAAEVQRTLAPYGVQFITQTEQRGTGDAVRSGRDAVRDRTGLVTILYGDSPLLAVNTLQQLIAAQQSGHHGATMLTTHLADPTGYGRILRDEQGLVKAIVEQKAATPEQRAITEINPGIYCFQAALLWPLLDGLQPNPAANEYYLTDLVEMLRADGETVGSIDLPDPNEVLGINTRVELAIVDKLFRDRKNRALMLDGVTIERPDTVTIDPDVIVGMDTIIEPYAQLLGKTVVGENCVIGSGAIVRDSVLADEVAILPYTLIDTSRIGTGSHVGPFARLRLENTLGPHTHVGNFVELKKATLGAGTKAGHLAYLGDAQIGSEVNIGAGTITCNYDGSRKHQTSIGDGAFVGSNSTLVAPVEVGTGSYVAAGSVITSEVPDGALGIGRSRQTTKSGWAARRRQLQQ